MKRHLSSGPGKADGAPDDPAGPHWRPQGPWPTADAYRLSLLASIQTAEEVDLEDFFRKAYPEVLDSSTGGSPAHGCSPSREGPRGAEDG